MFCPAGAGAGTGATLAAATARAHPTAAATTKEYDAVAADLRRVALVAVLVVPLAGVQTTLDVDLFALHEIFGERFGRLAPEDDPMPLGLFLALARLVVPHLGRGQVQCGHRRSTGCVAQLGVASEVADQN